MPTNLYIAVSTLWSKAFIKVRTHRQLFEYSVIVDRSNAQKFVLPSSLDSALPPKSSLLFHFFCQGQAKDLHEGANYSNIDASCMNVQRDLACVAHFQSCLHSLKYLWLHAASHMQVTVAIYQCSQPCSFVFSTITIGVYYMYTEDLTLVSNTMSTCTILVCVRCHYQWCKRHA